MKLNNILIGAAIGGLIAYLILKPKKTTISTKTNQINSDNDLMRYGNSSGNGEGKEDLTKHFSNELDKAKEKFVDFDAEDNFSKDLNAPQSQPYIVTYGNPNISGVPVHAGFSYPDKNTFQMSPFKH